MQKSQEKLFKLVLIIYAWILHCWIVNHCIMYPKVTQPYFSASQLNLFITSFVYKLFHFLIKIDIGRALGIIRW